MESNGEDIRLGHVGYYLVDEGRKDLEARLGAEPERNPDQGTSHCLLFGIHRDYCCSHDVFDVIY